MICTELVMMVLCELQLPTQKIINASIGHENATDQINRKRTVFENSDDDDEDDLINTRSDKIICRGSQQP